MLNFLNHVRNKSTHEATYPRRCARTKSAIRSADEANETKHGKAHIRYTLVTHWAKNLDESEIFRLKYNLIDYRSTLSNSHSTHLLKCKRENCRRKKKYYIRWMSWKWMAWSYRLQMRFCFIEHNWIIIERLSFFVCYSMDAISNTSSVRAQDHQRFSVEHHYSTFTPRHSKRTSITFINSLIALANANLSNNSISFLTRRHHSNEIFQQFLK